MTVRFSLTLLFTLLILVPCFSGTENKTASKTVQDTNSVNNLLKLAEKHSEKNYELSYKVAKQAWDLAVKLNYIKGQRQAETYFGNYAYYTGNYHDAIRYYVKTLKYFEKQHNIEGIADLYNNIGNVYYGQNNLDKALSYFQKALPIYRKLRNFDGLGKALNNIGNVFFSKEEYTQALIYYKKSLGFKKKIHDLNGEGLVLNNIGNIYGSTGEYELALDYFKRALNMKEKTGDQYGTSLALINMGYLYTLINEYEKAEQSTMRSIEIAKEIKSLDLKKDAYSSMANIYFMSKRYKNAYEYLLRYTEIKDSLINETTQKNIKEIETKYNSEKKDALHKAQLERLKLLREKDEAERQRKDVFIFGLIGLVSLVVVLLVVLVKSNRTKQKSNQVLNEQKQLIELKNHELSQKNKNITDSITYAKYLQEAILPAHHDILTHLPHSFILYKPKDIVAGDFYFFEVLEQANGSKYVFIAAADSTGHGVPGAMVSVVCSNALTRSVKEFGLSDPGQILDKTRELVLETFSKSQKNVKDGMDISLLVMELTSHLTGGQPNQRLTTALVDNISNLTSNILNLKWAGANNPLWYIEDNEIKEIAADKQPIGLTHSPKPFTTHELPLSLTKLFLFTDGYADQFGGERGKKLGYKQFKTLLTGLPESSSAAKEKLEKVFDGWAANHEQLDDVCVVGIKF